MLGDGLAKNKSCLLLVINACNINKTSSMAAFMPGFQNNTSVNTLCLNENEIRDEQAILLLHMIKFKAERRDKELWREGLRKPSMSNFNKTFSQSPTAAVSST